MGGWFLLGTSAMILPHVAWTPFIHTSKHQENRRLRPDGPNVVNRKSKISFQYTMPLQWSSFWIKPSLITFIGLQKKNTILNHTGPMSAPHLWSVGCTTLHWQRPLAVQALHNTYALASHIGSGSMITLSSFQVVLWKYRHFRKHKKGSSKRQHFPNLSNLPAHCMTPPCCSQLRSHFPYLTSSPALPPVARALATPAPAVIKGHQKITTGGHRRPRRKPLCQSSSWVEKTENESTP